ncbi:hypothetical protein Ahy_B02g060517 [Arachis hypogaea]|uniref:MULE transposase domain-containing protein n=1 Tax=Arachis hypogaea TaxID=3818 RepID=A0A445AIL0_ARAHY|nr:hypothetical protein Ahy_B02g060517 [Arachis hypogaea]
MLTHQPWVSTPTSQPTPPTSQSMVTQLEILEEAEKFYKDYSKLVSFSMKIRNTTQKGNEIKNKLITYSREGKWKSKISPTLKTNPSAGINCPARIYVHILKDVGLWIISKICSNNTRFVRRTIENNEEAGIRPSKIYQSFVAAADAKEFGNVNHHDQSTLLRCVLMKNKNIQSFKWLFEFWLRCMGGKEPKGILTDQYASMQRAIETCMPTTIHRWCIWHIMKKIPSKVNG